MGLYQPNVPHPGAKHRAGSRADSLILKLVGGGRGEEVQTGSVGGRSFAAAAVELVIVKTFG